MIGYSHTAHQVARIESGKGFQQIGALQMEAGAHILWARLNAGVSLATFPPPPVAATTIVGALAWNDSEDIATQGLFFESERNNCNMSLMLAGTASRPRIARLYVINLNPIPVYVSEIRMAAVQLEKLVESTIGEDVVRTPEPLEERIRRTALQGTLSDTSFRLSDVLKNLAKTED